MSYIVLRTKVSESVWTYTCVKEGYGGEMAVSS
jgi:hypothetical protein